MENNTWTYDITCFSIGFRARHRDIFRNGAKNIKNWFTDTKRLITSTHIVFHCISVLNDIPWSHVKHGFKLIKTEPYL